MEKNILSFVHSIFYFVQRTDPLSQETWVDGKQNVLLGWGPNTLIDTQSQVNIPSLMKKTLICKSIQI